MELRVLVSGDRNWTDRELIRSVLLEIPQRPILIIEGECGARDPFSGRVRRGADLFSREIAEEEGFKVLAFPADWEAFKLAAGPIRNRQMILEGRPELVIAFHDALERSKGTRNLVTLAKCAGLRVLHVSHSGTREL